MQVNDELIDKLQTLCRLKFEGAEREGIKQDLEKMLAMVDKIAEVDTNGVAPLIHPNAAWNAMRPDTVGEHIDRKTALQNAPKHDSEYFHVPKVLDKGFDS